MFSQLRMNVRVFWNPQSGYYVTGYDIDGVDGPFDDWEKLTIVAAGNEAHAELARGLEYIAPLVEDSVRRCVERFGVSTQLFD